VLLLLTACLCGLCFSAGTATAATWDYTISTTDTPTTIDAALTGAAVDTTNREILLPVQSPADVVSFWGSGELDYLVLTTSGFRHYAFDGAQMREVAVLGVTGVTSPLAAAARGPYPDAVVYDASQQKLRHYSFTGSGLAENAALSVAGLTNVVAVGTAENYELAALVGTAVQHYSFTGSSMARNTTLEPSAALSNPLDVALASGGYDTVVLERDKVRWFSFTGSGVSENAALSVTGLTNAVAFAVDTGGGGYEVAVVDGTQVKHYNFTGSSMAYNSTLSVTSGLTNPRAVAIRPGSYDRVVVDGTQVKYYSFTGSGLSYNAALSVTVADIVQGGTYRTPADAASKAFNPGVSSVRVRVRAAHELPNGTSVTWSVTADGTNWTARWRVRGTASGTVLEVTPDNGATWQSAGTAADALPSVDNAQLWATVAAGTSVKWKATLATSNPSVTPKIATSPRGNVAVRLESDAAPNAPTLPSYGSCFLTSTPTLSWTFSDPDPGDTQSAYRVQIVRASDNAVVIDTGKVTSSASQYTVPASTSPSSTSALWSSGAYQFKYRVKVWDRADAESPWSSYASFCVVAFDRPRVAEIVSPPEGQAAPDPSDPSTHIVITPGMTSDQLPKVKAGAKVTLLVDTIGPVTSVTWSFPYGTGKQATVNVPAELPDETFNNPLYEAGIAVNRWAVEFWTDASLSVCPTGTVVQMQHSGVAGASGTATLNAPPYAAGVVVTQGSVYEDWFVVLQGRE